VWPVWPLSVLLHAFIRPVAAQSKCRLKARELPDESQVVSGYKAENRSLVKRYGYVDVGLLANGP